MSFSITEAIGHLDITKTVTDNEVRLDIYDGAAMEDSYFEFTPEAFEHFKALLTK